MYYPSQHRPRSAYFADLGNLWLGGSEGNMYNTRGCRLFLPGILSVIILAWERGKGLGSRMLAMDIR